MKRELANLSQKKYDLLIVGGGMYGAALAWEAASRGLTTALVEKSDYAAATSGNSLKIIHGGLRYLQQMDLMRTVESIRERKIMLRIAPHLVHPLPCLMPTYGHMMKSSQVVRIGLLLNDIISYRRNAGMSPDKVLPAGRVLPQNECRELLPFLDVTPYSGAALWTDAQAYNSERLVLSFVKSAVQAGADSANYVQVREFLRKGNRVTGVKVVDMLTDEAFEVQASFVVTAAGPWTNEVLKGLYPQLNPFEMILSKAMNLIIHRKLTAQNAFALTSRIECRNGRTLNRQKPRQLFFTPWRDVTIVGTTHLPYDGTAEDFLISESDVQNFIDELNIILPGLDFERKEVSFVHGGVLPLAKATAPDQDVMLMRHFKVIDHSSSGMDGLLSVVGVKYTTARDVAEKVINRVVRRLGRGNTKSATRKEPLYGGAIDSFHDHLAEFVRRRPFAFSENVARQLLYNYGSELHQVLKYCDKDRKLRETVGSDCLTIQAEIVHAVREESAMKLSDVVLRRTELGSSACPDRAALQTSAMLMAKLLGWNKKRISAEIEEVKKKYSAQ
jgi:glycerol-3-phosphate dehydrogenase